MVIIFLLAFLCFSLSPFLISLLGKKELPYSFAINSFVAVAAMFYGAFVNLKETNPLMIALAGIISFAYWGLFLIPVGFAVIFIELFVRLWILKPKRSTGKYEEVGPTQVSTVD
jgi:hypothetical protein